VLQKLGLSETAEAVYQAMLAKPRLNIAELCDYLGLSEQEIRVGIDDLVRFTLLRESRDEPGQLRTVSPEIGLEVLLRRQEEDVARHHLELATTKARVADVIAHYAEVRPNTPFGGTHCMLGLDAIQTQLEVLAKNLTSECISVMPGGAQSRESLRASQPLDEGALDRGISLLTLYQDSMRNDPDTLAYAQWLTRLGGQVRTAPVLPPRMLIFDRKIAIIPTEPTDSKLGALRTTEYGFVSSLTMVFEQAWDSAIPLGTVITADADTGLTPLDRELLKLLATGITDEAAGRRLGVSARTVRRQVAALMERLNATSRFEAGSKAAQRGWL
jgi:DNA-binding CsgD family transcriptional regulator/sugar-specific transcriptional regulator TrmB